MNDETPKAVKTTAQALAQQKADAERDRAKAAEVKAQMANSTAMTPVVPAHGAGSAAVTTPINDGATVDAYVNEHAGGSGAEFFRINKDAEYVKVSDGTVIPLKTEFTVVGDKIQVGWIKFNGKGNPPTRVMGPLFGGFVMPDRKSLGDNDETLWEIGLSGKPESPWHSQILLPLIGVADDQLYVFNTSSPTGRNAVGKLIAHYRRMLKREPGMYPVIKLDLSGFEHKDPRVGWVKTPHFTVIGRAPMDGTKKVDTSLAADLNDNIPF